MLRVGDLESSALGCWVVLPIEGRVQISGIRHFVSSRHPSPLVCIEDTNGTGLVRYHYLDPDDRVELH